MPPPSSSPAGSRPVRSPGNRGRLACLVLLSLASTDIDERRYPCRTYRHLSISNLIDMKTELELTSLDAACCPPLLDAAISEQDAEVAAQAFRALSDPTRVRLVSMVASAPEGEACVCE